MATYSIYSDTVNATTFDASAQSLINRMISAGETPGLARQIIIDTTIKKLKGSNPISFNFWDKADTFGLAAAHGEASSLLCWKNASYNLTYITKPSYVIDRGWTGDVFSSKLTSPYNPTSHAVNYSLNSAFYAFYNRINVATARLFVSQGSTVEHWPRYTDNKYYVKINDGSYESATSNDASGFWAMSRTSSSAKDFYRNKSKTSYVRNSTSIPNTTIQFIDSSPTVKCNQNLCFWWWGGGLTQQQENALEDIIVGYYLTQIGAAL